MCSSVCLVCVCVCAPPSHLPSILATIVPPIVWCVCVCVLHLPTILPKVPLIKVKKRVLRFAAYSGDYTFQRTQCIFSVGLNQPGSHRRRRTLGVRSSSLCFLQCPAVLLLRCLPPFLFYLEKGSSRPSPRRQ